MDTTKRIDDQITNFLCYVSSGWETELAFNCSYDMIYDIISADDFLNLCQSALKELAIDETRLQEIEAMAADVEQVASTPHTIQLVAVEIPVLINTVRKLKRMLM